MDALAQPVAKSLALAEDSEDCNLVNAEIADDRTYTSALATMSILPQKRIQGSMGCKSGFHYIGFNDCAAELATLQFFDQFEVREGSRR